VIVDFSRSEAAPQVVSVNTVPAFLSALRTTAPADDPHAIRAGSLDPTFGHGGAVDLSAATGVALALAVDCEGGPTCGRLISQGQQSRRWYSQQLAGLFQNWDVILAPVVPIPVPRFSDLTTRIDGDDHALRPLLLGRFRAGDGTSRVTDRGGAYVRPVGLQIIAAPFR
jgi:hypothetical protein